MILISDHGKKPSQDAYLGMGFSNNMTKHGTEERCPYQRILTGAVAVRYIVAFVADIAAGRMILGAGEEASRLSLPPMIQS
jgi:hypothetical protein